MIKSEKQKQMKKYDDEQEKREGKVVMKSKKTKKVVKTL